jgi:hypothetical protein
VLTDIGAPRWPALRRVVDEHRSTWIDRTPGPCAAAGSSAVKPADRKELFARLPARQSTTELVYALHSSC